MANTYTTTINTMYTVSVPTPDYVVNVLFTVTGVDPTGVYTASIGGNVQFANTADQPSFIPYDELTEEEVMGWINAATDNLFNYYANIDGQINAMINPPIVPVITPLPWETT
jgi:hypothetical protein